MSEGDLKSRFFLLYFEGVFTTETWFENLTTLREIEGQRSQRSGYFMKEKSLLGALRGEPSESIKTLVLQF